MNSIFGNIDDLYLFCQIIRDGSLLSACKSLGLPASTVSRRISAMEKRLNVRLLEKRGRELVATESGERAYEQLISSMEQLESGIEQILQDSNEVFGNLKLTMPNNFYHGFVGDVISRFLEDYPKVKLEIILSQEQQIPTTDRDLLMTFDLTGLESFIARPLFTARHGFYASEGYLRKYGEIKTVDALKQADWIAVDKVWNINLYREQVLEHTIAIRPKLVVNDITAVITAVEQGIGVSSLPFRHTSGNEKLKEILPEYTRTDRTAYLVYRERQHQPRALTLLVDALLSATKAINYEQTPIEAQ